MEHTRITLRIPAELASWLKAEAVKNRRSFNNEIVVRMEREKQEIENKNNEVAS